MKVIVVSCLEHLARYKSVTVGASHTKLVMIAFLTVRLTLMSHVLTMQQHLTWCTFEAPDMILFVQGHQSLTISELLSTASTVIIRNRCYTCSTHTITPATRHFTARTWTGNIGHWPRVRIINLKQKYFYRSSVVSWMDVCHVTVITCCNLISTDFSAWIHFWHKQFLPVNVTRSPVGKGFLHLDKLWSYWFMLWCLLQRVIKILSLQFACNVFLPCTSEAFLMKSISKCRHNFALNILVTFCTS